MKNWNPLNIFFTSNKVVTKESLQLNNITLYYIINAPFDTNTI